MAKNRLRAAKLPSLLWLPLPTQSIQPAETGLVWYDSWQAERYVRAWAASKGVQGGVKIKKDYELLQASCRTCSTFHMRFNYQPSSGHWILRKFADHNDGCLGAPTPVDGATVAECARACKSAFTAQQVARAVLNSPDANLDINQTTIRNVVSNFYTRMPSTSFIRSVKKATRNSMAADRAVEMAALEEYAAALRDLGHMVLNHIETLCCLLYSSGHVSRFCIRLPLPAYYLSRWTFTSSMLPKCAKSAAAIWSIN